MRQQEDELRRQHMEPRGARVLVACQRAVRPARTPKAPGSREQCASGMCAA